MAWKKARKSSVLWKLSVQQLDDIHGAFKSLAAVMRALISITTRLV
jgi:hypothetical protein